MRGICRSARLSAPEEAHRFVIIRGDQSAYWRFPEVLRVIIQVLINRTVRPSFWLVGGKWLVAEREIPTVREIDELLQLHLRQIPTAGFFEELVRYGNRTIHGEHMENILSKFKELKANRNQRLSVSTACAAPQ
jgi:hypothetical protein